MTQERVVSALREVFFLDIRTKRGLQKLNNLIFILLAALYLHSYIVPIEINRWVNSNLIYAALVILYLAPQVVEVVLFARDDLQYDTSGKNPYATFFQQQFPTKHIMMKFNLDEKQAVTYWFSIFNTWGSSDHPNSGWRNTTFERGYRCRVVYHLQKWSWRFFLLAVISLAVIIGFKLGGVDSGAAVLQNVWGIERLSWKLFYPIAMIILHCWLKASHRAEESAPTGVWRKWKEINDIIKTWLDQNASSISELEDLAK